ncbi:MAG TPA: winged helix-turn-helix domain-containing protein [Candidatus Angelobacter sp.]|jgi:DNA-binding winged helix-turn-helix (wHTH) protein/Tol biopolymer transport system component
MRGTDKIYKFGNFQLDPAEQLLLREGVPIALKPKVFKTLVMLVENVGSLVTKDQLVEHVWPGEQSGKDEGLAQNISQLRRALGNGSGGSSMIQTVPKLGFRFIAQVQIVEPAEVQTVEPEPTVPEAAELQPPAEVQIVEQEPIVPEAAEPQPAAEAPAIATALPVQSSKNRRSRNLRRVIFVLLGIAVIGVSSTFISQPPPVKPPEFTQITFSSKVEAGGGIHTEGPRLIFMERNGSQWPLMQTSIGGGGEFPFAAPFPKTRIWALSPDRTEWLVSSFTDSISNMPLWIVPVQGGPPLRVGDVMVDSANWFPDGKRIIAAIGHDVFSIDRDGRNRRELFSVQGRAADFHWHPDGSRFRFTVVKEGSESEPSLWEASPDGLGPHRVNLGLPPETPACCGMWMPNGKDYVFTAAEDKRGDIWVLREAQGFFQFGRQRPTQLTAGPIAFLGPTVSEGKRLFVFGANYRAAPVRYNQRTEEFQPYLTSESFIDLTFSPDGQWIAYIGEGLILWRSRPDGSERLQLTTAPMHALRPRWSHDGKEILFLGELPGASYTAFVVPAEGGGATKVFKEDKKYRSFADWSPDGKSVVMDVLAGSEPEEPLTLVNLTTGQASAFPESRGMRNMHWSPDGRFLAASSDDTNTLYLFNADSQSWIRAAGARSVARMEWSRDGHYLYFQDIFDPAEAVFRLDPETLTTVRVLDFSKPLKAGAVRCGFEGIAPDGTFLASIRRAAFDIYALDVDLP